MVGQSDRDARVADAAEAWLADPTRESLYAALLSAVHSRRAGSPQTGASVVATAAVITPEQTML